MHSFELWSATSANNGSNPEYRPALRLTYPVNAADPSAGRPYAGDALPAVVICPGGGYQRQAAHEGEPFAQLFALHGIVGAVLRYRVAPDRYPAAFADAARAMRMLKARAGDLAIDPQRIGIMGFSAGGHLASMIATMPDHYHDPEDDLAGSVSARAAWAILAYPVIDMMGAGHAGSRTALLGAEPDPAVCRRLSTQTQVDGDTPATFLFHTADDPAVPVTNSLSFAAACAAAGVSVEVHVHAHGRHGVGLALDDPDLCGWSAALVRWLGAVRQK